MRGARGGMLVPALRVLAVVLLFAALPSPGSAEPLQPGSTLESFSLEDQHGSEHGVDGSVRAILFAREMKGGELVKTALVDGGAELLAAADAVYISDVSGMPALIRRMFALPKMRKRGYPVLLDMDGTVTRDFPSSEGRATLIRLEASEVAGIDYYDSADAVRAALQSLRREPPASD